MGVLFFMIIGLSHGLKSVHWTLFTPAAPGPAFRVPSERQKNRMPKGIQDALVL